jgi:hypothetical protein
VDLADNVLMVERNERKEQMLEDEASLDPEDRAMWKSSADTVLHILKQRHGTGRIGRTKLYFDSKSMRWSDQPGAMFPAFEEVREMVEVGGGKPTFGYR